jgi:hypothetical protein
MQFVCVCVRSCVLKSLDGKKPFVMNTINQKGNYSFLIE